MKKFINKIKWYLHDLKNLPKCTYLCWKYPFLKLYNKPGFFQTWCYYLAIPKGWRKAFGIQLLKEMKHVALKSGKEAYKNMRIDDIKEKWGILDINGSFPNDVWKVIHKYEYISMHTCIDCGELATVRSINWTYPYCDKCIGNKLHLHFGHKHGPDWYGWHGNIDQIPEEVWKDEEECLNRRYGNDDSTGRKETLD